MRQLTIDARIDAGTSRRRHRRAWPPSRVATVARDERTGADAIVRVVLARRWRALARARPTTTASTSRSRVVRSRTARCVDHGRGDGDDGRVAGRASTVTSKRRDGYSRWARDARATTDDERDDRDRGVGDGGSVPRVRAREESAGVPARVRPAASERTDGERRERASEGGGGVHSFVR